MKETRLHTEKRRFILSGGGTGGHLFPAIAIANRLMKEFPESEMLFVGAEGRMEMEKVPKAGYKIEGLWISGFQRNHLIKNINLPLKLLKSFLKARRIIKRFKPHIAIGTGGYASFPILYIASKKGVPTLIQEQNFFPGITNKWLAKRVDRVCTVHSGMEKYFPADKIRITGNPVRDEIDTGRVNSEEAYKSFNLDSSRKTVLVVGGSLGARTLNEALLQQKDDLLSDDMQLIWQTGSAFKEKLVGNGIESSPGFWAGTFIDNMADAYAIADLVVSRAGAIAISELAIMGKAVILVPSPNVTEDHQTKNAMALVRDDAAILLEDKKVEKELIPLIKGLIKNDSRLESLRSNIKAFAKADATERIVMEVRKLLGI